MIRLALLLSLLTFVGQDFLPRWRADFTDRFSEQCLKTTPQVKRKSEIQSLVCGSSLKVSSQQNDWKNLGLIHILVVSGGHLSILAVVLMHIVRSRRFSFLIGTVLILFSLANQLQPPVLRALIEWLFRGKLLNRGWRSPEISLISTWIALPFCSTTFDLLSLALSFFAAVTVEQAARSLHRHPVLAAVALQIAVWWILTPLLFTMGVPHPLTSMTNIVLAPLLGATLIPLAMLAWVSGAFPPVSGYTKDPLGLGFVFDEVWEWVSLVIKWLAEILPAASMRVRGVRPLVFGFDLSSIFLMAIFMAACALLLRSRRERRREGVAKTGLKPAVVVALAIALAIVVHQNLR